MRSGKPAIDASAPTAPRHGDSPKLDVSAYLQRIAYAGPLQPTYSVLEALHLAHATHIPFENLDILRGLPIRLDLESLQAKLVYGARGGYCYEQNLLFAAALAALGFRVTPLAARVRYRTQRVLPRTHMLLLVEIEGAAWIADVGFGLEGLLRPVPFSAGQEVRHFAWTYRVIADAGEWMLQSLARDTWLDLYSFTLQAQQPVDYEVANHYTSTHPNSRFVQTLIVHLPTPEGRRTLRNCELIVEHGGTTTARGIADDDELLDVLAATFGLRFRNGTRFRFGPTET